MRFSDDRKISWHWARLKNRLCLKFRQDVMRGEVQTDWVPAQIRVAREKVYPLARFLAPDCRQPPSRRVDPAVQTAPSYSSGHQHVKSSRQGLTGCLGARTNRLRPLRPDHPSGSAPSRSRLTPKGDVLDRNLFFQLGKWPADLDRPPTRTKDDATF